MQHKLILLAVALISVTATAQIPDGYYTNAETLSGQALKDALYQIIKNHKQYPYTDYNTDVWDILKQTDKDPANPANVILLYSGWSVNAAQEYNDGNGWTREHVWAKSHGDFGTDPGAGTDTHHLRPADNSVNSAKSNKDFDNGGTRYQDGDGMTDCYTSTYTWEPRHAVKGDVARMMFYMAVRYQGEYGEPDLELVDFNNSSPNYEPYHGKLSTLLQWHDDDPVDEFERNRNNVIYGFQKNRNPFIDHPEYVAAIWGTTDLKSREFSNLLVYPIEQARQLAVTNLSQPQNTLLLIYAIDGRIILAQKLAQPDNFIDTSSMQRGIYIAKIQNLKNNGFYSKKIIIR